MIPGLSFLFISVNYGQERAHVYRFLVRILGEDSWISSRISLVEIRVSSKALVPVPAN